MFKIRNIFLNQTIQKIINWLFHQLFCVFIFWYSTTTFELCWKTYTNYDFFSMWNLQFTCLSWIKRCSNTKDFTLDQHCGLHAYALFCPSMHADQLLFAGVHVAYMLSRMCLCLLRRRALGVCRCLFMSHALTGQWTLAAHRQIKWACAAVCPALAFLNPCPFVCVRGWRPGEEMCHVVVVVSVLTWPIANRTPVDNIWPTHLSAVSSAVQVLSSACSIY